MLTNYIRIIVHNSQHKLDAALLCNLRLRLWNARDVAQRKKPILCNNCIQSFFRLRMHLVVRRRLSACHN